MYERILWKDFWELYKKHLLWLADKENGKRLEIHNKDFSYYDLSNLNLSLAIMSGNSFRNSDLRNCQLGGIDLSNCVLVGADFRNSFLYSAKLCGCNVYKADFSYSDMRYAEINGTDFKETKRKDTAINDFKIDIFTTGYPLSCPEKGSFTAYKRAQGYIIELLIPEDAQRSSAFGRKCRCDKAQVVTITKRDGTPANVTSLHSDYDENFIYTIGETVLVEDFDTNRWNECSKGIHFYITREEALYG